MLKKSGINKGNAMNYLAFIVRIVLVCVEKQGAVKPRDELVGKKRSLPSFWSVGGILNAFYPSPTDSPTPKNIFSYFELIPVCF